MRVRDLRQPGERCTSCQGTGQEVYDDWTKGYPRRRCLVCKGSGRMERDPRTGRYGPAKGAPTR